MWTTIGHSDAVAGLRRSAEEGRIAHAYLLVGPRQVGKMTLALDMARLVNCTGGEAPCGECGQCRRIAQGVHADVEVLDIESGEGRSRVNIGIDQVRQLQRAANLKPFEGRCRVFIVDGAERLSEEAANALLKVLEEPPEQVMLVLLTLDADALPPTIASRCRRLELRPLEHRVVAGELKARLGCVPERAEELARLCAGRIGWAIEAASDPALLEERSTTLGAIDVVLRGGLEARLTHANEMAAGFAADRDSAKRALALWLEWWRDVMVVKEGTPELAANLSRSDELAAAGESLSRGQVLRAVESVRQASQDLERNVNPRLALEGLMLSLPRLQERPSGG